jgi:hypothetical protein
MGKISSYFGKKKDGFVSDLKTIAGTEQLSRNWDNIKRDANSLFIPEKRRQSEVEEFYAACVTRNTDFKTLKKIYKNLSINVWIFIVITTIALLGSVYQISVENYFYAGALFSFSILGSVLISIYAFRAYQIKIRKLCNFNEWTKQGLKGLPSFNLERVDGDEVING